MLITERDANTMTGFIKLLWFSLTVVKLNWNVYSAKLTNRMNSIENYLHSSTGHFQIHIRERLKALFELMLRIRRRDFTSVNSILADKLE